ncbi:hypothetical protein JCM10212_001612 [Sporobolomyces blumeae]
MSDYTEPQLKALTVVKLKDILTSLSLPVTGKKDELVSRILDSSSSGGQATTTRPLDPTGQATDEPDGQGVGSAQEVGPAAAATANVEPEQVGDVVAANSNGQGTADIESNATAPSTGAGDDASKAQPEVSDEERRQAEEAEKAKRLEGLRVEEEKRKARLARFGGGGGATASNGTSEEEDAKKRRAEKFGLVQEVQEKDDARLNKSLDALDRPLGSNRRERNPKATSKTNPAQDQTVADKVAQNGQAKVDAKSAAAEPAAAAAADPELAKRLAQDEEKKRKRAERFGAPATNEAPQEKKTKTDA